MTNCWNREMNDTRRLDGWDEIAKYTGVSIRTAQLREQRLGMPVHRLPGAKSRVFAFAGELDDWLAGIALNANSSVVAPSQPPPEPEVPDGETAARREPS